VDDVYNNEKWGSKKSRFHYTSSLQSESNLFKNINDSDQAESGHSFQSTSNEFDFLNLILIF
jgi:hypothetical protein